MLLFRLLEALGIILAGLFAITQVIVPLVRSRPVFPMFRRGPKLERELHEAHEAVDDRELERRIDEVKKQK